MNILHNFLIPEAEHRNKFWAKQPIDDPQTINGFNGTFAFSEHNRNPQGIVEFLTMMTKNNPKTILGVIMQYLKEVTSWDTPVQNHTYIVDDNNWCVGYIKNGTTEEIIFSRPMKQWSKSYRKFEKVVIHDDQRS